MQANQRARKYLLALSFSIAAISTPLLQAADVPALPAYAPLKQHICSDCKATVPPEMTPGRGVVIAQGGFNTVGYWSAVDIDQATMTRFITQINQQTHRLYVVQSRVVQLSSEDLAVLIARMNPLWSSPDLLPVVNDVGAVWGLDLFDGAVRRKENGTGVIQGQGAELNQAIDVIWRRLAR